MPIVVLVTVPTEQAPTLARTLVAERLAGCVNYMPAAHSIYRWQGDVVEDTETLLYIKTDEGRYEELQTRIVELHPYDIPEIIALPILRGLPSFLGWLDESVRK